jgi:lysophospholipase L1-like esterase
MTKTKFLTVIFYIGLISYIIWETFWYAKVGLVFVKWHTHLILPFILFFLIYSILNHFKTTKRLTHIVFYLYVPVQLFEIIVQVSGIGKTHSEKMYGHFVLSYPTGTKENFYWIDKPNTIKTLHTNEFNFKRKINNLGYSDQIWDSSIKPNEIRLLCLGDSFTEGDGAHSDSNYVSFLKRYLNKKYNKNIIVMNAGKCGSDPFFNFKNYEDILQVFNPKIVFQTISTQDLLFDIPFRGGMERFEKGNTLAFQKKNKLKTFIYATMYFSRPFYHMMGYNEYLNRSKTIRQLEKEIPRKIEQLAKKYEDLCHKNGHKLIFVFFPIKDELSNDYEKITKICLKKLSKKHIVFDLREYYLTQPTKGKYKEYYWKKDGHHNSKGYELMAKGILYHLGVLNTKLETDLLN